MFTGIVTELAPVVAIVHEEGLMRLTLALSEVSREGLEPGASVAINGCCLTVSGVGEGGASFDVIRESLARTNLGDLAPGDRVNVERSARFGDEIGGHRVSGHITGVAEVVEVHEATNERIMALACAPEWMRYLFYKGFVALDGASLTISGVDRARCSIEVSLIPETIARTTFGFRRVGDRVNLEVDAETQSVVETVERLLGDPEWRREAGLA